MQGTGAYRSRAYPGPWRFWQPSWAAPAPTLLAGSALSKSSLPLLPALGLLGSAITVGGLVALGLAVWHRFTADRRAFGAMQLSSQATYLLAAGLLVLVTSRILSPQYIFWIVPFAALVARPKALLLLVACLLTTFVYPLNYRQFIDLDPSTVLAVNVRNALLLVLFCWLIWSDLRSFVQGAFASKYRQRGAIAQR